MRSGNKLIIEAGKTEGRYWKDIWQYRELFYFLSWRDILVRYKQTVIGIAWSVIRPLLTMIILTIVFGKIAKLPSEGVPYPILVFAAMLPWQFFSNALSEAGNSLIGNANLISKIYFPRLIIPTSAVVTSFIDFLISGDYSCRSYGLVSVYSGMAHFEFAYIYKYCIRGSYGRRPLDHSPECEI